jgi:hypothetical protein
VCDVGPLWSTQEPAEGPTPVITPPPPLGGMPPTPPGGVAMPPPPPNTDHLRPLVAPTVVENSAPQPDPSSVDNVVLSPPSSLPNHDRAASARSSSNINRGQTPAQWLMGSEAQSTHTPQQTTQAPTQTETMGLPPVASTGTKTTPLLADVLHSQTQTSGEHAGIVGVSSATTVAHSYEDPSPEISGVQAEMLRC